MMKKCIQETSELGKGARDLMDRTKYESSE